MSPSKVDKRTVHQKIARRPQTQQNKGPSLLDELLQVASST